MTFNDGIQIEPCTVGVAGWSCTPTPIDGERTGETWCRHDTGECYGRPCCSIPQPIAYASASTSLQPDNVSTFALVGILLIFLVRRTVWKVWNIVGGPRLFTRRKAV
ncbi:hypothetical protein DFR70_11668 [Nocardia tenerifensis]|uniref:Uncharacterized protein n=1 Tax=Nocardia tenerifensis TaxID=228006 RepID=A0A318JQD8_9NOCA|nr:hypothetical protein [Nocardia tenerifensis]PXX57838.1 hypothetical protein DFR70_11668 [Nocardia tenerifensis]